MTLPRKTIPGTDLNLSLIALGTVPIGGEVDEDQAFRLMDAYAQLGGNFIDTAEIYSDWLGQGKSAAEVRIGRWLRSGGTAKDTIVATKGGHPRLDRMTVPRLAPQEIIDDARRSRDRLGLDTIPLYYLHRDDPRRPVAEIIETLAELVDREIVRYIACSNWSTDRIRQAMTFAAERRMPTFVANQMRWSLAQTNPGSQGDPTVVEMDNQMRRFHHETQLTAVPYSSQAQGFFSGAYGPRITEPATRGGEKIVRYYYSAVNFDRLARVERLAHKLGRPATHVALAWLLAQPFPVFPIIGTTRIDHLRESCAAATLSLTAAQAAWLDNGQLDDASAHELPV